MFGTNYTGRHRQTPARGRRGAGREGGEPVEGFEEGLGEAAEVRVGQLARDVGPAVLQERHQAGPIEELVEVAGGGLEEERAPDQHRDQSGDDHRHDEQRAVEKLHLFRRAAVDADGHQQRRDHLDHVPEAEDERQLERIPEFEVLEQVDVVLEADEFGDVRSVPAEEGVEDARAGRIVLEEPDQDQRRDDEEVDLPVVPELVGLDFFGLHVKSGVRGSRFSGSRLGKTPATLRGR